MDETLTVEEDVDGEQRDHDRLLDVEERVTEEIREAERERERRGSVAHGRVTDVYLVDSDVDWRDEAIEVEFRAPDGTLWRTDEYALPTKRDGRRNLNYLLDYTGTPPTSIADLVGEEVPVLYSGASWCLQAPKYPRLNRLLRDLEDRGVLEFTGVNYMMRPQTVLAGGAVATAAAALLFPVDPSAGVTVVTAVMISMVVATFVLESLVPNFEWGSEVEPEKTDG